MFEGAKLENKIKRAKKLKFTNFKAKIYNY